MIKVLQHIYMVPLFISACFSLKAFRLKWPFSLQIFSVLLWVMCFFEIANILWKYLMHSSVLGNYARNTSWIDNISIIIQCVLYLGFYLFVLRSRINLLFVKALLAAVGVFMFSNWILGQGMNQLNTYSLVLLNLALVFLAIAYFDELRSEKLTLFFLSRQPLFWISAGSLLGHSATTPFLLTLSGLVEMNTHLVYVTFYIYLLVNCLMFIFYLIAFLCRLPQGT